MTRLTSNMGNTTSLTKESHISEIPPGDAVVDMSPYDERIRRGIPSSISESLERTNPYDSMRSIIDAEGVAGPTPQQYLENTKALRDYLRAQPNDSGDYGYNQVEQHQILFDLASSQERKPCLQRFGRLADLCLLHYQDELLDIDMKLSLQGGFMDSSGQRNRIRLLLLEYCKNV